MTLGDAAGGGDVLGQRSQSRWSPKMVLPWPDVEVKLGRVWGRRLELHELRRTSWAG